MLAKGLLEFETLSGDEIKDLLAGKRPVRESVIEPQTPRSSAVPPAGKRRPRPERRRARSRRSRRAESGIRNPRMAGPSPGHLDSMGWAARAASGKNPSIRFLQ